MNFPLNREKRKIKSFFLTTRFDVFICISIFLLNNVLPYLGTKLDFLTKKPKMDKKHQPFPKFFPEKNRGFNRKRVQKANQEITKKKRENFYFFFSSKPSSSFFFFILY